MTKETAIEIIAQYDGWALKEIYPLSGKPTEKRWYHNEKSGIYSSSILQGNEVDEMQYATSLDWLHPVAMRVLKKLSWERYKYDNDSFTYQINTIRAHCSTEPVDGEYIDLLLSTAEGIAFLNQQKVDDASY